MITFTFSDGFSADMPDDDKAMKRFVKKHGDLSTIEFDDSEIPKSVYERGGLSALVDLEWYLDRHEVNMDALYEYIDNQHGYNGCWDSFENDYIGQFDSDDDAGYHLVFGEPEVLGHEVASMRDTLVGYIDYEAVIRDKCGWHSNGHYFWE